MYSPTPLPVARARVTPSSDAEPGGLESSLLQLVHDHHQSSLRLRELTGESPKSPFSGPKFLFVFLSKSIRFLRFWWNSTEKKKKEAIRNAARVSDLLVEAVNGGVQDCFVNEKCIELEIRALAATITRFMKQTDQWLAATHAINTAVKVLPFFL